MPVGFFLQLFWAFLPCIPGDYLMSVELRAVLQKRGPKILSFQRRHQRLRDWSRRLGRGKGGVHSLAHFLLSLLSYLFLLFCFLRQIFSVCPKTCSVDQDSLKPGDPPASATKVQGLKVCVTATQLFGQFLNL